MLDALENINFGLYLHSCWPKNNGIDKQGDDRCPAVERTAARRVAPSWLGLRVASCTFREEGVETSHQVNGYPRGRQPLRRTTEGRRG